jgi:hypothetical protein
MRLVACAVCIAALALPAAVLADGDPASDYLVVGDAYLPYPPPAARTQLYAALAAVQKANDKVKVAVIATPTDLGSIPSLFGHPADYAKFLGLEITFAYTGALLVVMPAGYGFYDDGNPTPAADAALGTLSIADKSPDGLTQAAAQAVTALAHAGALTYTDTRKPTALPLPETAHAGKPVKLLYRATDDSGRAAVVLTVLAGSRSIALFKVAMRAAVPGVMYSVTWHVPATAHGAFAFCARATDPSGNRSPTTCAKLTVR